MNSITKNLQLTDGGWKSLAKDAKDPDGEDEPEVVGAVPTSQEQIDAGLRAREIS